MTGSKSRSTRRAFFLSGGAAIGAGVATAVGASALKPDSPTSPDDSLSQLRGQLASAEAHQAIRNLHLAFTALIENQAYEPAAELFDEHAHLDLSGVSATGKREILQLLTHQYRHQNALTFHRAYRQNSTQQQGDAVTLSEDRLQAAATFHVDVELCTPLQGDCTVTQMARLQGHVADRRWEAGRFEAKYVETRGEWKVTSLRWLAS
jgi:hypothetical protein